MKGHKVLMSHKNDCWETPTDLFDKLNQQFNFNYDAAASKENTLCHYYADEEINGLETDWGSMTWCNPPYSKCYAFVEKAYDQWKFGGCKIVMLLPARTDTRFFHEFIYNQAKIEFIKGRLKFTLNGKPVLDKHGRPQSATFPSMLVYFL